MSDPISFTYAGSGKPPSARTAAHAERWRTLVEEVTYQCDGKPDEWHSWTLADEAGAKQALSALRRYLPRESGKPRYRLRSDGARVWVRRGGGEGA